MPLNLLRAPQKRNVLIAVAGQTPAIIMETLWAFEQQRGTPIDEIRVITTAVGHRRVVSDLLGEGGQFARYCLDYRIPAGRIAFSEKHVHLLKDGKGRALEDIRNSADNDAAANQIFALVQEWCRRSDEALFCSIAGGRKTMGVYLAMSLMLCGRSWDSLSHVLVAPEFETGVPDFFYPPPQRCSYQRLAGYDSERKAIHETISSEQARVELADIRFPALSELIGGGLPLELGFTNAVSRSQLILACLQSPPLLILYLQTGQVTLGGLTFRLSRQLLAVYAFFLLAFNTGSSGYRLEELFDRRLLLADLERRIDQLKAGEQETYAWEKMPELEDFRARLGPCISKVNRAIDGALGKNRLSARYRISTGKTHRVDVSEFEIQEPDGHLWQRHQLKL